MNQAQWEILHIAMVTAAACSLPGVFLILRKMAMMSDAISHTILLGIVIAFFITHDLNSPALLIGAALMGLVTVFLVEFIQKVQKISEDSSIGLVFPLLFSIGVLLISRYAGDVHLDTDAVLLGELAFAPFDRLVINHNDLGPKSLYVMSVILLLNLCYIGLFYKELKIVTFDPMLAGVLGISPAIVHYSLMTLVSITAVGAFNAVGAILVVALMIGPPATAYFITEKLRQAGRIMRRVLPVICNGNQPFFIRCLRGCLTINMLNCGKTGSELPRQADFIFNNIIMQTGICLHNWWVLIMALGLGLAQIWPVYHEI